MRITIGAVGRLKAGPESELADRYRKRFDASGKALGLGPISIIELVESRDGSEAVRRQDEAARLLAKSPADAVVIALDERGGQLDSQTFADMIARYRDDGASELRFLIGGPDGHGGEVEVRARERLALGGMSL